MPWLNIPNNRRTVFIEPYRPPGGLLGGSSSSGKMSKLQALAAARKKKAEDQKLENRKIQSSTKESTNETTKEPKRVIPGVLVERLGVRQGVDSLPLHTKAQTNNPGSESTTENQDSAAVHIDATDPQTEMDTPLEPLELAAPSAFAQTLLGSPASLTTPVSRNQYLMPYMSLTSSVANAFSEPSPDDVVLSAQSKGSLVAKKVQA